jgi:hypothetical protein
MWSFFDVHAVSKFSPSSSKPGVIQSLLIWIFSSSCVTVVSRLVQISQFYEVCLPLPHISKLPFSLIPNLPTLCLILHRPIQPHPLLLRLPSRVSFDPITPCPFHLDTYLTLRLWRHKPIDLPQIPTCLDHAILPIPTLLGDMWLESVVDFG